MSDSMNRPDEPLKRIFIRAVTEGGDERYLDVENIRRIDQVQGRLRVGYNLAGTNHFYLIPDLSYAEAREKLGKLPGLQFLDLSQL